MEDVDLELNGGVLDSTASGDIEHLQGEGNNDVKLVNADADLGLDVTVTNIAMIDMNNRDLTIDYADLTRIDKVMGDTQSRRLYRSVHPRLRVWRSGYGSGDASWS